MDLASAAGKVVTVVTHDTAGSALGHSYRVGRLTSAEELAGIRDAWAELTVSGRGAPLFQSWEWVTTWWHHYGAGMDMWVLAAWDEAGQLAGLLPLMVVRERQGPLNLRRLTFLGRGVIYPIHLDVLARQGAEQGVCSAFVSYLSAQRREWDVLDLGDMNEDSCLRDVLRQLRGRVKELTGETARVAALPASWQVYERENLSSTRRKHLGQYRRKLEREHPNLVRFYQVSDVEELEWAMDAIADLNRARWQIGSAYDDPVFVAFHRQVAQRALECGWLRFFVLRVGDEMAAGIYGFLYEGVYYAYQASFNANWGKYGPGQLLFGYGFEQIIAEGGREWDMLRGDQEYKLSWTDRDRMDAHLIASVSVPGHLWLLADGLVDAAKTIGKQRLPRRVRERLNRFIAVKGIGKHEPAKTKDVSD